MIQPLEDSFYFGVSLVLEASHDALVEDEYRRVRVAGDSGQAVVQVTLGPALFDIFRVRIVKD